MSDGTKRVVFENVEVIDRTALVLLCRIDGEVCGIPYTSIGLGTELMRAGDRGKLVLREDVARTLGLLPDVGLSRHPR